METLAAGGVRRRRPPPSPTSTPPWRKHRRGSFPVRSVGGIASGRIGGLPVLPTGTHPPPGPVGGTVHLTPRPLRGRGPVGPPTAHGMATMADPRDPELAEGKVPGPTRLPSGWGNFRESAPRLGGGASGTRGPGAWTRTSPSASRGPGCPIHNRIPEWNDLVHRGRWRRRGAADCSRTTSGVTGPDLPCPSRRRDVLGITDRRFLHQATSSGLATGPSGRVGCSPHPATRTGSGSIGSSGAATRPVGRRRPARTSGGTPWSSSGRRSGGCNDTGVPP